MTISSDGLARANPSPLKLTKRAEAVLRMSNDEFLKDLHAFMEKIGQPITKMPSLGYQELDLHLLLKLVLARGGMDEVTRRQEWKLVYQDLGLSTMSTSASYNTRTNYKKYLYLYELEVCDWEEEAPPGMEPRFAPGQYVRIESSTYEGQVFYAQISKHRFRNHTNMYYVHYNGWSTSHDEWMPEGVLQELQEGERANPGELTNPSPTRSSKSNYIIYDPLVSEKHHHAPGEGRPPALPRKRKPAQKSASASRDLLLDEGDEDDEHALLLEEFAGYNTPKSSVYDGSSPQTGGKSRSSRSSRRNHEAATHKISTMAALQEELEHLVDERDEPHREHCGLLGRETLGEPIKVYYNGGQWRHSTPKVRKFHLHYRPIVSAGPRITVDSDRLAENIAQASAEPIMFSPDAIVPPPSFASPKQTSQASPIKASPSVAKVKALLADPKTLTSDRRSIKQLQDAIQDGKTKLRAVNKEYRRKMRQLEKYYGLAATSSQVAALLSTPSMNKR